MTTSVFVFTIAFFVTLIAVPVVVENMRTVVVEYHNDDPRR